jgi:hypothetical protein
VPSRQGTRPCTHGHFKRLPRIPVDNGSPFGADSLRSGGIRTEFAAHFRCGSLARFLPDPRRSSNIATLSDNPRSEYIMIVLLRYVMLLKHTVVNDRLKQKNIEIDIMVTFFSTF